MSEEKELRLPEQFVHRMQCMLGDSYPSFLRALLENRETGLRANTLKQDVQQFVEGMPFSLEKVPWAAEGFFYEEEEKPGRSAYHEAGAFYIQEPSAMLTGELAMIQPGERVCDLCAAPGGKTTQLLAKLQGKGMLVSNEIIGTRAHILSQNVERFGGRNVVVLNEDTAELAQQFPCFFDVCVVDAPCSGEGMFRKNEAAVAEWSPENVQKCAERQLEILENAHRMLGRGGRIVYSTCTFAPMENEGVMAHFLQRHPEYALVESDVCRQGTDYEIEAGSSSWARAFGACEDITDEELDAMHLERCYRLWPHKLRGEGHFAAVLKRKEDGRVLSANDSATSKVQVEAVAKNKGKKSAGKAKAGKGSDASPQKLFSEFAKVVLVDADDLLSDGFLWTKGEHVYLLPKEMQAYAGSDFHGFRFVRAGLELGELHNGRFLPAHALSHAIRPDAVKQVISVDKQTAMRYLQGESIPCENEKGYLLVVYEGYPLGWGKASNGQVKNHYPKGIRIYGYKEDNEGRTD